MALEDHLVNGYGIHFSSFADVLVDNVQDETEGFLGTCALSLISRIVSKQVRDEKDIEESIFVGALCYKV